MILAPVNWKQINGHGPSHKQFQPINTLLQEHGKERFNFMIHRAQIETTFLTIRIADYTFNTTSYLNDLQLSDLQLLASFYFTRKNVIIF